MMTQTRLWKFSVHAQSRGASRLNLILDEKARIEISHQLDGKPTRLFGGRDNIHVYEIAALGIRMVVVCDIVRRVVITMIDSKRYFRRMKGIRGRRTDGHTKHRKDRFDEEMDYIA
jgi:hypothetical protein